MDEVMQRIEEFSKNELQRLKAERKGLESSKGEAQPASPEAVDIYQRNRDRLYDYQKRSYPKGSSAIVNMAVYSVLDGYGAEGLAHAFKRAKEDVDALKAKGERGRVELLRQQYMQEHFLPAVELVVNSTSPDEVLNSNKALDELDKYALLEGSGKGYTASYIRQAYGDQLGQVTGRSDHSVQDGVRKINMLLDEGQNRTAYGIASGLKSRIDRGEAQADDTDYDLIGRVVAYYG